MGTVEENNKELIRRQYEHYNRQEFDAAHEYFSDEMFSEHFTREQVKESEMMLHNAFPDLTLTIVDIIAEGDKVAFIVNGKGTHTGGPYFGIPATGKEVNAQNTYIDRIVDNKIVEGNGTASMLLLLQQLGVMPTIEEAVKAYNESKKE